MSRYNLEIVVFITGASVMMLELAGSRVLAPYLGTSIIVWTSLIGVVLGSLSLGYFLGGRLADRNPSYRIFSTIIFATAVFITLDAFLKELILATIQTGVSDLRVGAVLSTVILFSVPTILLGMVSPYAVRLRIKNLKKSGKTVGNLYAISTVGSIFGTFITGFYLIPIFGNTKILVITSALLVLASIIANLNEWGKYKLVILLVTFSIGIYTWNNRLFLPKSLIDIDTVYNRVWIYDAFYKQFAKEVRLLSFDSQTVQSGMFINSDELVFDYTKFYRIAEHFKSEFKNTLMIGGAAYSYPKYYLYNYPDSTIDVVEIDSELTELAREHFRLKADNRLKIFHEDARTYLNRESSQKKYDVVLGDAFSSSFSVPHHLTTKEAVENTYRILDSDGVAIVNVISSIEGDSGKFLRAEYRTYKSVFPQVYVFPVRELDGEKVQNILLVALKYKKLPSFESDDVELNRYLSNLWTGELAEDVPVLTDDFAPVNNYLSELITKI